MPNTENTCRSEPARDSGSRLSADFQANEPGNNQRHTRQSNQRHGLTEQNNPGDPRSGVRLTQKTIDIVRPGTNGTTKEQQTIQTMDSNGDLSTVWVDTRQKTGGGSILVDTRKGDNPSTPQPKPKGPSEP